MALKGWDVVETSSRTGVSDQSIRNLIRLGHTRTTIPCKVTAITMVRLLQAFPSLTIKDFVPNSTLQLKARRA